MEKGWSQERLALTCDLDRTYVSALERRVWNVSLSNIEKIALALDTEPWRLLVPVSIPSRLPILIVEPTYCNLPDADTHDGPHSGKL